MRKRRVIGGLVILCGVLVLVSSSLYPADPPVVGEQQKKINEAVDNGVKFLLSKPIKGNEAELVILTLLHAGVDPKKNVALTDAITNLQNNRLDRVYTTAVTAMALEMADRQKYQMRIAQCAQALVDYQCENGQWDYTCRYDDKNAPKVTGEVAKPLEAVITGEGEDNKPKVKKDDTKPMKKIITARKLDPKKRLKFGDNSNTQFALLGLRSAARSGVEIPEETWKDAAAWFEKCQLGSGGWSYSRGDSPDETGNAYGSMTCAGLCGMAIAKFYLKEDIQNDGAIQKGLGWLSSNLTFPTNPSVSNSIMKGFGPGDKAWHFYYVYGVERVASVLDLKNIGSHDWYQEGADYLLSVQSAKDGSWNTAEGAASFCPPRVNTCFAILFLKKATPVMIKAKVTGDNEK